jgi:hypothetical protein
MRYFSAERLAGLLYGRYCSSVGGKAFNGAPLPDWKTFRADPSKQIQSNAWIDVANEAIERATPGAFNSLEA